MPAQSTNVADGKTFEAPLRTEEREAKAMSGARGQSWNSHIAGVTAGLFIDRAANPDVRPVKGDRVRALSRSGQPWFDVAFVDERDHARIIVHLVEG